MRDSLSLFDQAIAHAAGAVRAEDVRQMLGLADRARIIDLFEALMRGDIAAALKELREQYDIGADPAVVLSDLAEFTHFVTRVKIVPAVADDVSLAEAERMRGRAFAAQAVDARAVARLADAAQGHRRGRRPRAGRSPPPRWCWCGIAYAADLPTPDEVMRSLERRRRAALRRAARRTAARAPPARPAARSAPRFEAPRGAPRARRLRRRAAVPAQPIGARAPARAAPRRWSSAASRS